ncbi:MAG: pantoate--beta-alanine ligase [Ginsengibacter sp.]
MLILKRSEDIQNYLTGHASASNSVGLVPTMGALHNGHLSLLRQCMQQNIITVASIFVNPTQFNNKEDFEKYPVTIEKDIYVLERNGCDVLFLPGTKDIYPNESFKDEHFELGSLETILEGRYRPGHFQGVCQAVKRLLQLINPTTIYAGQKDYQQCLVIKKLLELMDSETKIVVCKTEREADGLAMSSRNMRLEADDRRKAPALYHALHIINAGIKHTGVAALKQQAVSVLESADFKVDYVEIAEAETLQPINTCESAHKSVALVAATINNIRLIDNLIIKSEKAGTNS